VDRSRRDSAPVFLLCDTYRYHGHHVGDVSREYYRSRQEEQTWKTEHDPIGNMGAWLVGQELASSTLLDAWRSAIESEMKSAVESALAAPYPGTDEVAEDVYA